MTEKANHPNIVRPGNAQHIGARSEQQDSFGFSAFDDAEFVKHAGFLCVVADGMGGLAMGKESSDTAVRTFLTTYEAKEPDEKIAEVMDRALHAANRAVTRRAAEAGVEGEAGTTLVAVAIHGGKLYRAAAGDSRIYLFRQGTLRQLTTDYNYGRVLDRMVAKGEISRSEADSHPSRAALTSYLGKQDLDDYDQPADPPLELLPGDKILLASDGLFGFLPTEEIIRLLAAEPQPAAEALVQATIGRQSPYQDNITVAVLGYDLPPVTPPADTQRRDSEPKSTVAARAKKKDAAPQKASGTGKWAKIVLLILGLAIAGFFGGRYFGEQGLKEAAPAAVSDKPAQGPATDKKTEQAPEKSTGKTPEKTLEKTDKAAPPAK